jgi:hypothetical protein
MREVERPRRQRTCISRVLYTTFGPSRKEGMPRLAIWHNGMIEPNETKHTCIGAVNYQ